MEILERNMEIPLFLPSKGKMQAFAFADEFNSDIFCNKSNKSYFNMIINITTGKYIFLQYFEIVFVFDFVTAKYKRLRYNI